QAVFTQSVLGRLPGRAALRARLQALEAGAAARVEDVQRSGDGAVFYLKRGALDDQFKLYGRGAPDAPERLIFDPEAGRRSAAGAGQRGGVAPAPRAINYYRPSPDGRQVAVGVSTGGSEDASLQVIDAAHGRAIGPAITRAQYGAVSWSPDGREIYFHRMRFSPPRQPGTERYQRSEAVVMRPGAPVSAVRTVLRAGRDLGIPPTEFPLIDVRPDGRVIARVEDGVSPDFAAWHTTLAQLRAGRPDWQPLVTRADHVTALAVVHDRVVALSFKDAPRYHLIGGPIAGFDAARASVLLPQSEQRVLIDLAAAADGVYVKLRDGNVQRLLRLDAGGGAAQEIALPVAGSFEFAGVQSDRPGVWLDLQGWTRARRIVAVSPRGEVKDTGLQPAGPFDAPADVVATEVEVVRPDGARVPMSIVHRRGVALDGSHPLLLWGYASYGLTEEPWFSTSRLAWLEAGGVFAVANPRGSGVRGRAWHEAGRLANKPNSWRDFIACAEWLVQAGWTRPGHLAIWGGSAGGLLVGRAMTERPDLFAAVISSVGSLDTVRAETTPNGVPNIPEFGSRVTEPGFRALLEMSTYHHIRAGVAYPGVLLTHGVNDPRVEVWESTKTGARLQAATSSGRPVLLRLDFAAGHGYGNTKSQELDEVADVYAFALWQAGVPAFQPRTP
ncbi:MAG: prolyl oligopeptidase family serine peptidase, partial [Burkholderiaceae bacterium]